ncbi:RraA family protein [Roseivivax sp. CAU 1761]
MSLAERFCAVGTAVVSDVLDEAGFPAQTLDPRLAAIGPARAFCGPAICVRAERRVATRNGAAAGALRPLYALPGLAAAGGVLVLATGGFRGGAVLGGLLADELAGMAVAGCVTDGLVRDRAEVAAALPVHAAGAIPANGARRVEIAAWDLPVALPGPEGDTLLVTPGDMVLGDGDGAVVIPAAVTQEVLAMAEELAAREDALTRRAAAMGAEDRARARAERLSHVVWLRDAKEMAE